LRKWTCLDSNPFFDQIKDDKSQGHGQSKWPFQEKSMKGVVISQYKWTRIKKIGEEADKERKKVLVHSPHGHNSNCRKKPPWEYKN